MVEWLMWYVWTAVRTTPLYACIIIYAGLLILCGAMVAWVVKGGDSDVE